MVSLGPGKFEYLAPAAKSALLHAEVIVGYKTYMDLIDPEILAGKETLTSGMKGEIKRCRIAIDQALEGKDTAIVSSGDSGIYGMAGLIIELIGEPGPSGQGGSGNNSGYFRPFSRCRPSGRTASCTILPW